MPQKGVVVFSQPQRWVNLKLDIDHNHRLRVRNFKTIIEETISQDIFYDP